MAFAQELQILIESSTGKEASTNLKNEAQAQIEKLTFISRLYRKALLQEPKLSDWLEQNKDPSETFSYSHLERIWESVFNKDHCIQGRDFLEKLQRFRRLMSIRIAFREVNQFSTIKDSLIELSVLAEFCIQTIYSYTYDELIKKEGIPWNEELNEPARFCILSLGKLGANELNFCSDIDLIYTYQGQGFCIKEGKQTGISNQEFFTKLCQKLTQLISLRNSSYFLYNVDLRLRPDGEQGLIIRSFTAMQNYYSSAGQT